MSSRGNHPGQLLEILVAGSEGVFPGGKPKSHAGSDRLFAVEATLAPGGMELSIDFGCKDRGGHEFSVSGIHQVEMDMRE